ncbi:MAG: hypothetical protein H6Q70_1871 [Firmicutes bacterium]|nr:hypothetical protein [Bacillota bacterium]
MEQYQTTGQDLFNSIAQGYNSNSVMQYILKLKGKIDFYLLEKAVKLSFYHEPILGCRLIKTSGTPIWESIDNKKTLSFCYKVSAEESQKPINTFLERELSPETGAQVLVCLIRGKANDTLCVKICHAACDGCGSKYYIKLLAELYTRISQDTNYMPKAIMSERSTKYLYKNLGIENKQQYFQPELAELKSSWGFPRESTAESFPKFEYKLRIFEKAEFDALYKSAKEHGTTLNSVILAAYYSGLLKTLNITNDEKTKEIQVMIDLRKYLPSNIQQTICNLSSAINIKLPVEHKNDLEHLIDFITTEMEHIKIEKPFIHGAISVDLVAEDGFDAIQNLYKAEWEQIKATGNFTPMFSNLGVLSEKPIYFAKVAVDEVDFVSPAFYAPAIMLGTCTYRSRLSLCISYYSPEVSGQKVDHLLDSIINNLNYLI